MGNLGFQELMVILLIVLVLFGPNRIPQIMGGLGQGIKSFKKGLHEAEMEGTSAKQVQTASDRATPPG